MFQISLDFWKFCYLSFVFRNIQILVTVFGQHLLQYLRLTPHSLWYFITFQGLGWPFKDIYGHFLKDLRKIPLIYRPWRSRSSRLPLHYSVTSSGVSSYYCFVAAVFVFYRGKFAQVQLFSQIILRNLGKTGVVFEQLLRFVTLSSPALPWELCRGYF